MERNGSGIINILGIDVLRQKFLDMNTPGFVATLTDAEAARVYFDEQAISDEDAEAAMLYIVDDE